jgi:hypothetical protein
MRAVERSRPRRVRAVGGAVIAGKSRSHEAVRATLAGSWLVVPDSAGELAAPFDVGDPWLGRLLTGRIHIFEPSRISKPPTRRSRCLREFARHAGYLVVATCAFPVRRVGHAIVVEGVTPRTNGMMTSPSRIINQDFERRLFIGFQQIVRVWTVPTVGAYDNAPAETTIGLHETRGRPVLSRTRSGSGRGDVRASAWPARVTAYSADVRAAGCVVSEKRGGVSGGGGQDAVSHDVSRDLAALMITMTLHDLERYYDAVPRSAAKVEEIGPLTLFVRTDAGIPFYARPDGLRMLLAAILRPDMTRKGARRGELHIR